MGKKVYLDVADKKVLATEITYEDLVVLYKQFIKQYKKVPTFAECTSKNNLPQSKIILNVIENHGQTYKEFLLQFGKVKLLTIGNIKKNVSDVTYEDLIILYKQYVEKYNKVPTSTVCGIKYNLPPWTKVNQILQSQDITHDDFLQFLGYKNGKRKYDKLHVGDIVGRWKIISKAPDRYTSKNQKVPYWLCQCTCGSEIIREVSDNALQTGDSTSCGCVQQEAIKKLKGTIRSQSFYDWCIENNHQDFLYRWDYDLNEKIPQDVSYCAHERFYFKCPSGKHNSTSYELAHVCKMKVLRCKYCKSFAQRFIDIYGENALDLYWDYERNEEDPWELPGSSRIKTVWLKCINTDYHGSYEIIIDTVINSTTPIGCPYCSHTRIHPKDSFGQYLVEKYGENAIDEIWDFEKNTVDPFAIAPSTRKHKVWLKCNKISYHPSTCCYPNDVHNHSGYCHYCASITVCKEDSLGYLYPQVLDVWSDKNEKSPYEYLPYSSQEVWWKCKDGKHEDYLRKISDSTYYDFRCPKCSYEKVNSLLQEKVSSYIKGKYNYELLHENKCNLRPRNPKTNAFLSYDNEISNLKLIIEVHGAQHYEVCGFTYLTAKHYNITPEQVLSEYQERDRYKEEFAINQGYNYLIIPYWTENDESYKELIDNKIKEILEKQLN